MTPQHTDPTTNIPNTKRIPWWFSIICAIATYCTLKYVLPELAPTNQTLKDFFQLGPVAAPVLTIPFLLLAAKQLYDKDLPAKNTKDSSRDET